MVISWPNLIAMTKPTQLTIEHLAAYLPYGVPLRYKGVGSNSHRIELHPLTCKNLHNAMRGEVEAAYVTIILRPLSQLTEDYDGESGFVDYHDWLLQNCECTAEEEWVEAMFDDPLTMNLKIRFAPYSLMKELLAAHFDVFGLIEAGLAVAMNPDGTIAQ